MGTFSVWHWLIVLLVVVLLFGTKKLRGLGGDLGAAVKGFKQGMKEEGAPESAKTLESSASDSEDSAAEKTDSRDRSV